MRELEADSSKARNIPGAREKIYRDLRWAGLEWDEGELFRDEKSFKLIRL